MKDTKKTSHQHESTTRNYTHNVQDDGFDRCVEICTCGAERVLTRECGEPGPAFTKWSS